MSVDDNSAAVEMNKLSNFSGCCLQDRRLVLGVVAMTAHPTPQERIHSLKNATSNRSSSGQKISLSRERQTSIEKLWSCNDGT